MSAASLLDDPLLRDLPEIEGYKVLGGVVLYQKLGQGGMGAVYRGKHLRLNIDVAVKVMVPPERLPPDQADSFVKRFIREAQSAAAIGHENLVRVYDVNSEAGVHFLIMDYVDGESAADRLKRKGKVSEEEAVEIALGAAQGLAEAHRKGIVHRDVKPDNIMIDKDGRVRVADLGLAKAFSDEETGEPSMLTQTATAMGTPAYMPPEQFASARDVGPQADVWSLGVTLYQLLTGKVPWSHTSVFTLAKKIENDPLPDAKKLCAGLSDGVCSIVARSVQKAPPQRYGDCGEMAEALRTHLETIRGSRKSVLPDAEAGAAKPALASVTPPPAKTLTLIAEAALEGGREEGATSPAARPAPAASRAPSPKDAKASGGRGRPGWIKTILLQVVGLGLFHVDPRSRLRFVYVLFMPCALLNVGIALLGVLPSPMWGEFNGRMFFVSLALHGLASIHVLAKCYLIRRSSPALDSPPEAPPVAPRRRRRIVLLAGVIAALVAGGVFLATRGKVFRHDDDVNSVAFSPDGRYLATGSDDKTAALWDVASGGRVRTFEGHANNVTCVAFSPDGRRLATGSDDGSAALWDVETGARLAKLRGHEEGVRSVAFSPDGRTVATGSFDGSAALWDASTGERLKTLWHRQAVRAVVFSPDGRRLATACSYGAVCLWDPSTGWMVAMFQADGEEIPWVNSVAFSPDGRRLAAGSADGTVVVWDVFTSEQVRTFKGPSGYVAGVAFSPDGRWLAAGGGAGDRGAVEMWDVSTDQVGISSERRHADTVCAIAFSPDGRYLATGSWDDTARLWPVDEGPEEIALGGGVKMALVYVRPGRFMMGTDGGEEDEKPVHEVVIMRAFRLGKYEVTREQYERIMGSIAGTSEDPKLPVWGVSWDDAVEFCRRLSERTERTVRLPTEAEWEYACRAGSTGTFSFGDDEWDLGDYAWYKDNLGGGMHPVGGKLANAWGLHDMHGSLWEWCSDRYDEHYYRWGRREDPAGPPVGHERVLRGGCWVNDAKGCGSAHRNESFPSRQRSGVGFRVAVGPAPPVERMIAEARPALDLDLGEGVPLRCLQVPAGEFMMGSPDSEKGREEDEGPQRRVRITRPFYMGATEVTQAQYERIMAANPCDERDKGPNRPVYGVSWDAAAEFCRRLSERTGRTVRLPTEAEWEYACRAGSTGRFCFGDDAKRLPEYTELSEVNDEDGTISSRYVVKGVGQRSPNTWGLHDMHGSVEEWCADWYDSYDPQGPSEDPTGPEHRTGFRVIRGAGLGDRLPGHRSAKRGNATPTSAPYQLGFRVVVPAAPGKEPVPQAFKERGWIELKGHRHEVVSVTFSPDGRLLATGGYDGTIAFWEVSTGKMLRSFKGHVSIQGEKGDEMTQTLRVYAVTFSPDGRSLATAGSGFPGTVFLWNVSTGKRLRTFEGHERLVSSVAFSLDGRYLATGSEDQTVALWDVSTGRTLRTFALEGNTMLYRSVALSPDGRYLAAATQGWTAPLWDVATGERLRTFGGHMSVAFSPDGRYLATGTTDKVAALWDVATGEKVRVFEGHTSNVVCVAFSPDGRRLATGSWDSTAALWDVSTGKRLWTFEGHAYAVTSVAFSPDGRYLATGSADKTARIWLVPEELRPKAGGKRPRRPSPGR